MKLTDPTVLIEAPPNTPEGAIVNNEKALLDKTLKINNITYEIDNFKNEVNHFKDTMNKSKETIESSNVNKDKDVDNNKGSSERSQNEIYKLNSYEMQLNSNKRINNYKNYFDICAQSLESIKDMVILQNKFILKDVRASNASSNSNTSNSNNNISYNNNNNNSNRDFQTQQKISNTELNQIINNVNAGIYNNTNNNFTQIGGIFNIEQKMNVNLNVNLNSKSEKNMDIIYDKYDLSNLNHELSMTNINESCLINESAFHDNIHINKPDYSNKKTFASLEKIGVDNQDIHQSQLNQLSQINKINELCLSDKKKSPSKSPNNANSANNSKSPSNINDKFKMQQVNENYEDSNIVLENEFKPKEILNKNFYNNKDSHSKKMSNL